MSTCQTFESSKVLYILKHHQQQQQQQKSSFLFLFWVSNRRPPAVAGSFIVLISDASIMRNHESRWCCCCCCCLCRFSRRRKQHFRIKRWIDDHCYYDDRKQWIEWFHLRKKNYYKVSDEKAWNYLTLNFSRFLSVSSKFPSQVFSLAAKWIRDASICFLTR